MRVAVAVAGGGGGGVSDGLNLTFLVAPIC